MGFMAKSVNQKRPRRNSQSPGRPRKYDRVITLTVTDEWLAALDEAAAKLGQVRSEYIRRAVEHYVMSDRVAMTKDRLRAHRPKR